MIKTSERGYLKDNTYTCRNQAVYERVAPPPPHSFHRDSEGTQVAVHKARLLHALSKRYIVRNHDHAYLMSAVPFVTLTVSKWEFS